jgi:hypothetical protein
MERSLPPPTFINSHGKPKTLDATQTYNLLSSFLVSQTSKPHYAPSTQTSQLERLTDSIGITIGAVDPDEAEEHERERERVENEERERTKLAREEAVAREEREAEEIVKTEKDQMEAMADEEEGDDQDDDDDDEDNEDEEGAGLPANEKTDEIESDGDVDMK